MDEAKAIRLQMNMAVAHHCLTLTKAIALYEAGKPEAAWAMVEGAITTLGEMTPGTAAPWPRTCPACNEPVSLLGWVAKGFRCPECDAPIDLLKWG